MKIVAHPLVVAAALGLIGPVALEDEDENPVASPEMIDLRAHSDDTALSELHTVQMPSAEEIARLDLEWKQLA